jgi:hypothetical protein
MIAATQTSTTRRRLQNVDKTGEFFNRIGRLPPRIGYCCGLGYGPLISGAHSHPQVSGVLQPTRCQDSLPGGVICGCTGGIATQPNRVTEHAIAVVHKSASDCARDHPGDSNSDRSDD